jgi:hypothetical protein
MEETTEIKVKNRESGGKNKEWKLRSEQGQGR